MGRRLAARIVERQRHDDVLRLVREYLGACAGQVIYRSTIHGRFGVEYRPDEIDLALVELENAKIIDVG